MRLSCRFPSRRVLLPLLAAAVLVAAGAGEPISAAASAQRGPAAAPSEGPLIAAELKDKDDAEVTRALSENYVKYEHRIAMRDGVRLYTVTYVPRERRRTYPILLLRTPYGSGPYGIDNYPDDRIPRSIRIYLREGYIISRQDVRGRFMSEGAFVDVRPRAAKGGIDEATDAWDTIDWLVKNIPANNGRVGVWGISYPGFYAAQSAIEAHPALKAVSPQAPVTDWFIGDDFHHNGAFFLAPAFDFYSVFGKPRPKPVKKVRWEFDYDAGDAYEFFLGLGSLAHADEKYFHGEIAFWNDVMAHGSRDEFWKARDPRPYYKNVKPAILTVGGLFDAEDCWGAFATYRAFAGQSPGNEVSLVMGPWSHGGWVRSEGDRLGDVSFGSKTSHYYQEQIEFPFFQRHLKGITTPGTATGAAGQKGAWVFETGINLWQHYPAWPPPTGRAQTLYFHAGSGLSTQAPTAAQDAQGADSYPSDPQKPVPYRDKPALRIEADYMISDQRFASRRPDVLFYQTAPLTDDVTLAGPVEANLSVAVTGTDADFVVKLIDVYPPDVAEPEHHGDRRSERRSEHVRMAGYQQLVRAEIMRGKFRNSFERPEPFVPGETALVRFALPDISHTFRPGHRIMVQVQSSWFPLVDRNPQSFVDIYHAKDSDFHTATHRVLRTKEHPSSVKVTVLRGQLP